MTGRNELWSFGKEDEDAKNAIIAMEFVAPYMAWQMQQNSLFFLNQEQFNKYLENAYKLLGRHFNKSVDFRFHIQDALQKADGIPSLKLIRNLLEKQLCLFIKIGDQYKLMHQQFRDALAAMHLINSIYLNGKSRPTEWNSTVDNYVMRFVADLIDEKEANRLWEQNRTSPQLESATLNQLELQRRLHHCDFSKLDFSGLDLSKISMYPYRFGNTMLKLPTDADAMKEVQLSEKTFSPEGHGGSVSAVAVITDGKRIVSGSWDCTIRVWDLETGSLVGKPIEGHRSVVSAVAVTVDGKRIISGSYDHTIRVWDLETGSPVELPIVGHSGYVCTVTITPNGKRIVSGSEDRTIRVRDLETSSPVGLPGHTDRVTAVAVTMDGKHIVSGSWDDTIRVWDLETGVCLKTLEGHKRSVEAVAVTTDGKRIVSGSMDNTIRVWDLETGACLKTMEGHTNSVYAVAVTSDGKRIVSGSLDHTIRVWDMDTGACLKTREGHTAYVIAVAVTFDGKRIVSGSGDDTIRIWDLESGKCLTVIRILPLSFVGLDFSKSIISTPELKETLRQNGAIV